MSARAEETRETVWCESSWGKWYQTLDSICIEIKVPEGVTVKDIKCTIKTNALCVVVQGNTVIEVFIL